MYNLLEGVENTYVIIYFILSLKGIIGCIISSVIISFMYSDFNVSALFAFRCILKLCNLIKNHHEHQEILLTEHSGLNNDSDIELGSSIDLDIPSKVFDCPKCKKHYGIIWLICRVLIMVSKLWIISFLLY